MNFISMPFLRLTACFFSLFLGFQSLHAQINQRFTMEQISEQEKSFHSSLQGNNLSGLSQSLASANFSIQHYRCEWAIDPAIRYQLWNVTADVPGAYQESYNIAEKQFAPIYNEIKSIGEEMKNVETTMEKSGAPYTPGRLPDWKK